MGISCHKQQFVNDNLKLLETNEGGFKFPMVIDMFLPNYPVPGKTNLLPKQAAIKVGC